MAESIFNEAQEQEIEKGKQKGLNTYIYSTIERDRPVYSAEQMAIIRTAMEEGYPTTIFTEHTETFYNASFTAEQMVEILEGYRSGVDVSRYAYTTFPGYGAMSAIHMRYFRYCLENNFDTSYYEICFSNRGKDDFCPSDEQCIAFYDLLLYERDHKCLLDKSVMYRHMSEGYAAIAVRRIITRQENKPMDYEYYKLQNIYNTEYLKVIELGLKFNVNVDTYLDSNAFDARQLKQIFFCIHNGVDPSTIAVLNSEGKATYTAKEMYILRIGLENNMNLTDYVKTHPQINRADATIISCLAKALVHNYDLTPYEYTDCCGCYLFNKDQIQAFTNLSEAGKDISKWLELSCFNYPVYLYNEIGVSK